jgi:hypothetical protein
MTALLSPGARELADAMAATFEREDLAGSQSPWCPERDALVVRRWITDRSRELGGGIRRVVRFARVAAMAGGGDYIRFLYGTRIPSLRAAHFRAALQTAHASGWLPRAAATLLPSGVVLHEASMRPADKEDGAHFAIDFVQMPRLAALLDILHNALGYGAVADLLEPILVRGTPRVHADDVARALHADLNAWLADRLDSPHYIRQAQTMRVFLARRGWLSPEAIDDETILAFWTTVATEPNAVEVEGFRLFTSAARAMLRYRRSLLDSAAYGAIGAPLSLNDNLDHQTPGCAFNQMDGRPWQSPLRGLASRPANAVKWLTKREWLKLLNYLGGPHPDGEGAEPDADEPWREEDDRGLAGGERFDLGFLRTLLRADVFGAAQAVIVARLRKRAAPAVAVEEALIPATDDAYAECAAAYAAVHEQLRLESFAALMALLEQGALEALVLVGHLVGRDAVMELLELAGIDAPASPTPDAVTGVESGLVDRMFVL